MHSFISAVLLTLPVLASPQEEPSCEVHVTLELIEPLAALPDDSEDTQSGEVETVRVPSTDEEGKLVWTVLPVVRARVRVALHNDGLEPITLVLPGDGSSVGWRTPIIRWDVERLNEPINLLPDHGGRCGNINTVRAKEIVQVEPGAKVDLDSWIPPLSFRETGLYQVRFHYENRPSMKWGGAPLGEHDEGVLQRIRESTACQVVSEPLILKVQYASGGF